MTEPAATPLIRDISDTARWAAWCRAVESERPDAHFRDPLAKILAGDRGQAIENAMRGGATVASMAIRTVAFDQMILDRLAEGDIDTVINLAAGLDTRPYRLSLPKNLHWIEVDLPDLISFKEATLAEEQAVCQLERVAVDLADAEARKKLLASIGEGSRGALVLTEGLLIYLEPKLVADLADDLAAVPVFQTWLMDLLHPRLLPFVVARWKSQVAGDTKPQFAPEGGPAFFRPHGWTLHHWVSAKDEGRRLKRELPTSWLMRLMNLFASPAQREEARKMNSYVRLDRQPI